MSAFVDDAQMILVLDINPPSGKSNCPLSTCKYVSTSTVAIVNHMWKFRRKNAANKACRGQKSPSLTLYPKLFLFADTTQQTLSDEYPYYDWERIVNFILPQNEDDPPNIVGLIRDFDMFITTEFLQNYPNIFIPPNLRKFSS